MLVPIFAGFANKPDGSPPVGLASAEVKFDIPLPANFSYDEAERLLDYLALFLVPYRNRHAGVSCFMGREVVQMPDGAIHGKRTYYFGWR